MLDEKFAQVLMLHYIDGMTRKQIAELLGISEDAIKSRLRKALDKLRSLLPTTFF